MKRSGGVTVAAIVLIFGSGLLVLLMAITGFSTSLLKMPRENGMAIFLAVAMYGFFAVWGIVTAVGILRLYQWARYSILIMSGFTLCCLVLGLVGITLIAPMIENQPDMGTLPPHFATILLLVLGVWFVPPAGISIWWLVLFTRPRVRWQFDGKGETAPERPSVPEIASAPPQIPTSIRVIAILFLIFSPFALIFLPLTIEMHLPTLILGVLVQSPGSVVLLSAVTGLNILLPILLLQKKSWALDALIALQSFGAINVLLLAISPSRDALNAAMAQKMQTPPGADFAFTHGFMFLVAGFSLVLTLIVLYFLITRRAAYRAACAASDARSSAPR